MERIVASFCLQRSVWELPYRITWHLIKGPLYTAFVGGPPVWGALGIIGNSIFFLFFRSAHILFLTEGFLIVGIVVFGMFGILLTGPLVNFFFCGVETKIVLPM